MVSLTDWPTDRSICAAALATIPISFPRQLMTYMMEDSRTIPSVLTALFCARSIERIGDRCQNICEFIFYYVKGQDFRHVGGDELDKLLAGKDPKE
ncbi:PhoU domain-containing protein [Lysinibacillus sp. 1 U-2021]|uniref:PhoU domain-containing protein n=1 Tax=Lysinibacillus sp. 1 U-2021 TaxID=3039426 RepID=UPI0032B02A64